MLYFIPHFFLKRLKRILPVRGKVLTDTEKNRIPEISGFPGHCGAVVK